MPIDRICEDCGDFFEAPDIDVFTCDACWLNHMDALDLESDFEYCMND